MTGHRWDCSQSGLRRLKSASRKRRDRGWASGMVLGLLALAAVSAGGFVGRSLRHRKPVVTLHPFADRRFSIGCVLSFVLGIGLFGSVYLMPVFLVIRAWARRAPDRYDHAGDGRGAIAHRAPGCGVGTAHLRPASDRVRLWALCDRSWPQRVPDPANGLRRDGNAASAARGGDHVLPAAADAACPWAYRGRVAFPMPAGSST